jgi:hypothetical protein
MSEISLGMLSAAVTDLSARVEALDVRIEDGSDGSSTQMESRLRAVEAVLTEVRKEVSKLAQNKAASEAQSQLRRPWHMLTSEQAEKRWKELRAWVDWLVVRDNIGTKEIPDCWYLHGGVVDELEALRWAWLASNKPDSKMIDPIWWREGLHRARARWPSFNPNGCTTSHTEIRPRGASSKQAWDDFLAEELADRPADRPSNQVGKQEVSGQLAR